MAEPYTPKKPSVARRTLELFNAFVGAGFKYEELFPQPPPKQEAQKPAEKPAVEVQRPEERGLRREGVERSAAAAGLSCLRLLSRKAPERRWLG